MSALAQRRTAAAAAIMMLFALVQYVMFAVNSTPAGAAGGDFKLDFAAAAPQSYNHSTGGGAWDDKTTGVAQDVVESLEGGDFACGDVVTYLQEVVVDARAAGAQSIELDYMFLANTTGQPGVAHSDVVLVQVNRGNVQDLIEGSHPDSGLVDDGGSVAANVSETFIPAGTTPFSGAATLDLTVAVTDLEASERVIIRIDVLLTCDPGSRPTGNLQADLSAARVTDPASDVIAAGNQTIPFKQVGDITVPPNPAIDIEKTPDSQSVVSGSTVTFSIWVKNTGDVALSNVAVTDVLSPNCDKVIGVLAVGEEHTYECTLANVTAGFTNVAVVVGTPPTGPDVDDTDDAVVTVTAPPTGPPGQPTPTGSIGDYVWLDANANGRQDDPELPAVGVKVELLNSGGAVLATAVTDVNGGYLFDDLAAGTYQVRFTLTDTEAVDLMFTLADSIDTTDDLDSDAVVQGDQNVGLTGQIVLGAGVDDLTRDAGIVRLSVQGIQIEPTTTTTTAPTTSVEPVAVATLPFTGVQFDDIVKLALLIAAAGSTLVFSSRPRKGLMSGRSAGRHAR